MNTICRQLWQSAALAAFMSLAVPAPAGLMDLLRGEKPAESFQRVAFVGHAVVKEVDGAAEQLHSLDRWVRLEPGTALKPGDIIRTRRGTVILRMTGSESLVKVTPQTLLRLAEFEQGWPRSVLSGREERHGFVVRGCRGRALARQDGEWKTIRVDDVLAPGTEIQSEPGSTLDLFSTALKQPVRVQGPVQLKLNAEILAARVAGPRNLAVAEAR